MKVGGTFQRLIGTLNIDWKLKENSRGILKFSSSQLTSFNENFIKFQKVSEGILSAFEGRCLDWNVVALLNN